VLKKNLDVMASEDKRVTVDEADETDDLEEILDG
jgi:hypothetical protein